MARGPKKHLKRLAAPRSWMLDKLGGTWAPRPSTGPHKLRECLPLTLVLRNRLKYALTRRECLMIVMRRHIQVDGKVRTDMNFPSGFMDVISIPSAKKYYRILYDSKGRFCLHEIKEDEAKFKLCRVQAIKKGDKHSIGHNPSAAGQNSSVPFAITHDGRTVRYVDPLVKTNDSVKIDLKTNKIVGHVKFDIGNIAFVTRGNNVGRIGVITHKEKHPGSFDIVHIKDKNGHEFSTRLANVFVIGQGTKPEITLGKGMGVYMNAIEARDAKAKKE